MISWRLGVTIYIYDKFIKCINKILDDLNLKKISSASLSNFVDF